jgi:hypothetical protein
VEEKKLYRHSKPVRKEGEKGKKIMQIGKMGKTKFQRIF